MGHASSSTPPPPPVVTVSSVFRHVAECLLGIDSPWGRAAARLQVVEGSLQLSVTATAVPVLVGGRACEATARPTPVSGGSMEGPENLLFSRFPGDPDAVRVGTAWNHGSSLES